MRKLTIREMIRLYTEEGLSLEKIAKKLGYTGCTISKYLKQNGIEVINKQNILKYDNDTVFDLYNKGENLSEIARKLGVSQTAIVNWARRNKVTVVNYQNRLRFDNTVFEKIDTEEKAYWLGFMYADGYVGYSSNQVSVALAWKDHMHVKKFAIDFLKHDSWKIKKYDTNFKGCYSCKFFVNNKKFREDLISKGCLPRKSLILKFPKYKIVPKSLIHHFIRGYFDGDGSITTLETSKNRELLVMLLGTTDMLQAILNEAGVTANLHNNSKSNSVTKVFSLAVAKGETFLEFIYKDATVFLDRKHDLWTNYCRSKEKSLELLEGKLGEVPLKQDNT